MIWLCKFVGMHPFLAFFCVRKTVPRGAGFLLPTSFHFNTFTVARTRSMNVDETFNLISAMNVSITYFLYFSFLFFGYCSASLFCHYLLFLLSLLSVYPALKTRKKIPFRLSPVAPIVAKIHEIPCVHVDCTVTIFVE